MELNRQLVHQGFRLYRWRSYLPLAIIPLVLFAMHDGEFFRMEYGDAVDSAWESLCIAVAFAGLALRAFTVGYVPAGTSGRNTRTQQANALNRTGMYSVVRHPIYLANYVIVLGILLFVQSFWLLLAGTLIYWLYYERIMLAEEDFLRRKFGAEYSAWAAVTPSVIPKPRLWKRPELPFSPRAVLAREHATMYAVVLILTTMDFVYSLLENEPIALDEDWLGFLGAATVLYLVLRTVKKHTRWLQAKGR